MSDQNYRQQIKLYNNATERKQWDQLANLFSLIKTIDSVEQAWQNDFIDQLSYENTIRKLLSQLKTQQTALASSIPDLNRFIQDFSISANYAAPRIAAGVPATEEHRITPEASVSYLYAQIVQHFITAMDAIKLGMVTIDQILPLMNDLKNDFDKLAALKFNLSKSLLKLISWKNTMSERDAAEEITESEARQLSLDLDTAYSEFMGELQK